MATTIMVSDATKQMLDTIKDEEKAASFDDVVKKLASEHLDIPTTMYGWGKGKDIGWKKEHRGEDRELPIRRR
jgi:predicted CopG family antitoxin